MTKSAQRRRKHCTLAVVRRSQKNSSRRRSPFRGARGGQILISCRWALPLPTDPVWWGSMQAISNYHGQGITHPKTHTHTHTHTPTHQHTHIHKQTGPTAIHCAAASAQCIIKTLSYILTAEHDSNNTELWNTTFNYDGGWLSRGICTRGQISVFNLSWQSPLAANHQSPPAATT